MNLISRFFDVGELVFGVGCVLLSHCYLMVIIFAKSVFGCRTIGVVSSDIQTPTFRQKLVF